MRVHIKGMDTGTGCDCEFGLDVERFDGRTVADAYHRALLDTGWIGATPPEVVSWTPVDGECVASFVFRDAVNDPQFGTVFIVGFATVE